MGAWTGCAEAGVEGGGTRPPEGGEAGCVICVDAGGGGDVVVLGDAGVDVDPEPIFTSIVGALFTSVSLAAAACACASSRRDVLLYKG